jgi:hypothetical protein
MLFILEVRPIGTPRGGEINISRLTSVTNRPQPSAGFEPAINTLRPQALAVMTVTTAVENGMALNSRFL